MAFESHSAKPSIKGRNISLDYELLAACREILFGKKPFNAAIGEEEKYWPQHHYRPCHGRCHRIPGRAVPGLFMW